VYLPLSGCNNSNRKPLSALIKLKMKVNFSLSISRFQFKHIYVRTHNGAYSLGRVSSRLLSKRGSHARALLAPFGQMLLTVNNNIIIMKSSRTESFCLFMRLCFSWRSGQHKFCWYNLLSFLIRRLWDTTKNKQSSSQECFFLFFFAFSWHLHIAADGSFHNKSDSFLFFANVTETFLGVKSIKFNGILTCFISRSWMF
jgi:hypothetical protein